MTEQNAGAGSPPEIPDNSTGVDRPDTDAEIMLRGANAMMDELEKIIPRNDADRDYSDTVRQYVFSERAFRNSAEARIEYLQDEVTRLEVKVERGKAAERALHDMAAHKTRLEAEVQRMRGAVPRWTRNQPQVEGWYARCTITEIDFIHVTKSSEGILMFFEPGECDVNEAREVSESPLIWMWAGPYPEPLDYLPQPPDIQGQGGR